MTENLKRCPFCGSESEFNSDEFGEALEVILDEAQKDEPCIMAIKVVAYTTLKGESK